MGNARLPGPLSQIDQPIGLRPGIIALTAAALPGPTGTIPIGLGTGNSRLVKPTLIRLEVSGAKRLPDGHQTPANTTNWVVTPQNSPVTVRAITMANPTLTWSGNGRDTPDVDDEARLLDVNQPGKFTVSCVDGRGWRSVANVYVLWARMTGYKGDGGGTFSSDNLATMRRADGKTVNTQGTATGRQVPAGNILDFDDFCESQYTVAPPEFLTDGNAQLFDAGQIRFLVTRRKQSRAFLGDVGNGQWTVVQNDAGFVDDTDASNSMLNPFSASGHLYSNDGPGLMMKKALGAGNLVVIKHRMRELVKVTFDGSSPASGAICSDEFAWHDFRSMELVFGKWQEAKTFGGNELIQGDKDFGQLPTP